MILGDFPPSSKVILLIFGEALFEIISLPTIVDPVKEILSTKGDSTSHLPAVSPFPVMILTDPAGKPKKVNL